MLHLQYEFVLGDWRLNVRSYRPASRHLPLPPAASLSDLHFTTATPVQEGLQWLLDDFKQDGSGPSHSRTQSVAG
jgi:hypothetical protein